jgi:predicted ATPase
VYGSSYKRTPFLSEIRFRKERFKAGYPFDIAALHGVDHIPLHPSVTFFTGDNGSGKSTLLEAIAVAAGFNAEGGTKNFRFTTRSSESSLHEATTLVRTARRPQTGFFLRAESFFNVATQIEALDSIPAFSPPIIDSYGGKSLHEQSHGESFWSLFQHRLGEDGLYLFDEPESALSPVKQLAALQLIHRLVHQGSQFIIATHSPILLAYPHATIFELGTGMTSTKYDDCENVQLYRDFMAAPGHFLNALLGSEKV